MELPHQNSAKAHKRERTFLLFLVSMIRFLCLLSHLPYLMGYRCDYIPVLLPKYYNILKSNERFLEERSLLLFLAGMCSPHHRYLDCCQSAEERGLGKEDSGSHYQKKHHCSCSSLTLGPTLDPTRQTRPNV